MAVRLAALRKSEPAAAESRRKILQAARRKGKTVSPTTLELAGYVCVLSNVRPPDVGHRLLAAFFVPVCETIPWGRQR